MCAGNDFVILGAWTEKTEEDDAPFIVDFDDEEVGPYPHGEASAATVVRQS